jgi:polyhydroxyalkanoate synthesis repressor PhaR
MVTIKKYSNRRLYDTSRSAYINLEELTELVRGGETVQVLDARTGDDLTQEVLLEVVLKVQRGGELFPTGLLHRIVRSTGGDPWQRMLRQQLVTGMRLMSAQMDQVEAMFHGRGKAPASPEPGPTQEPVEATPTPSRPSADPELDELRARLAQLEERLRR